MITIETLSKSYRQYRVLDQIRLDIPKGEIFALLGPNGSGKTTLLKSLLGIVHPSKESKILIHGKPVFADSGYKEDCGYMPQFPRFLPHLKVFELVKLFENLRRKEGVLREKLISDLGVTPFLRKSFGDLSGGMMQKVNILLCFMFDPKLYVLDEPTQGLDPSHSFYLKQLILEKKKEGKTIVFTSHVMSEVEALADHMGLLVEGRIYAVTSPTALKKEKKASSLEEALHQFWRAIT